MFSTCEVKRNKEPAGLLAWQDTQRERLTIKTSTGGGGGGGLASLTAALGCVAVKVCLQCVWAARRASWDVYYRRYVYSGRSANHNAEQDAGHEVPKSHAHHDAYDGEVLRPAYALTCVP